MKEYEPVSPSTVSSPPPFEMNEMSRSGVCAAGVCGKTSATDDYVCYCIATLRGSSRCLVAAYFMFSPTLISV